MKKERKYEWKGALKAILIIAVLCAGIGFVMAAWDDTKSTGDTLTAAEWNAMVADQKNRTNTATLVVAASDSSSQSKAAANYVCDGIDDQVEIQAAINDLPNSGGKVVLLEGNYIKGNATGILLPSNVEVELSAGATIKLIDGLNTDASIFTNSDKDNGNENIIIRGGRLDCNRQGQTDGFQMAFDFENVSAGIVDSWIDNYSLLEGKAKNCNIEVINRRFLQRDIVIWDGEDLSEVQTSGTVTLDNSDPAVGDYCFKLTTPVSGDASVYINSFSMPNWEVYHAVIWVKFIDLDKIEVFWVPGGAYYGRSDLKKLFENNKWYKIKANIYPGTTYPYCKVRAVDGEIAEVYVDKAIFKTNPLHPAFAIVFDDARSDQVQVAPVLAKYEGKANVGLDTRYVGKPDKMTLNDLRLLYDKYGWDIVSHQSFGAADYDATNVDLTHAKNELITARRWLEEHGFTRGAFYHFYDAHRTNGAIEAIRRNIFSAKRHPVQVYAYNINYDDEEIEIAKDCSVSGLEGPGRESLVGRYVRSHFLVIFFAHAITEERLANIDSKASEWYDWGVKFQALSEIYSREDYHRAALHKPLVEPVHGTFDIFMDVHAEDTDYIVVAEDLTQTTPITCTIYAQPDVPRNIGISITDTDSSITSFSIKISGVDAKGSSIEETFDESGGLTQTGSKAFATISEIEVTNITGANTGDTLDIGIGSKLGLSYPIYVAEDVYKVKKNNDDWASANYTVDADNDIVDVSTGGAIADNDDFTIYYRSNLNIA